MADKKPNLKQYYNQLAKLFRTSGPIQYKQIANKIAPAGTTQLPAGTAQAFIKNAYNTFASHMAQYGTYSRMARYSDYASMESMSEIAAALDIYADETCAKNEYGHLLSIESPNPKIRDLLEDLYYETLNVEFNLWHWIRNLCKYGDQFLLVDHHPDYGVINALPMPVNEIERDEGYDEKNPTAYRYRWVSQGNQPLDNWQVIHFRLLGNDAFLPFGASMIEPARRTWRQLCVCSDAKVWVKSCGYKKIKDVVAGDVVLSFDEKDKKILETKVKRCSYMGKQDMVEVHTAHRKIKVTPNHGLLVRDRKGEFYYKKAEDLICSEGKGGWNSNKADRLVLPSGWENEKTSYEVQVDKSIYEGRDKCRKVNLDNGLFKTTPEFMRLFGFWFGDGWVGKNRLGFALGENEGRNDFYITLFSNIFKIEDSVITEPQENRGGQVNFNSLEICSVFKELGFVSGYNNKKIPEWVFSMSRENKINFIRGYFDADGSYSDKRLTSSNNKLIEQTRILCQQCGVTVGKEEIIDREAGVYKDSCFGEINRNTDSYRLFINLNNIEYEDYRLEIVNRVVSTEEGDTYDLEIDHETHNFTVDGVVSHNTLLEDAVMTYRIVRSPERRVFYVDVGNISPTDVGKYMEKFKTQIKRNQIVDANSGRVDLRYNALSAEEDYYIPIRGDISSRIDTLPGGTYTGDVDDLNYFQNKLFASLKIPKSYLGYEGDMGSKSGLSQQDVRFAHTIQRIQQVVIAELNKIGIIHLFSAKDVDLDDITNFEIKMANPSSISELQRLELWRTKFEVASVAQEGLLDRHFVYSRLLNLSEQDIEAINEGRKNDRLYDLEMDNLQPSSPEEEGAEGIEGGEEESPVDTSPSPDTTGRDDAGLPPPPSEEEPITAARDPMRQIAAPNELLGKKKKEKKKSQFPDLYNHVFNLKKTAMDPKRNRSELNRAVRNPFGESVDEEGVIFEKQKKQLKSIVDELRENESFINSLKQKEKKVIID